MPSLTQTFVFPLKICRRHVGNVFRNPCKCYFLHFKVAPVIFCIASTMGCKSIPIFAYICPHVMWRLSCLPWIKYLISYLHFTKLQVLSCLTWNAKHVHNFASHAHCCNAVDNNQYTCTQHFNYLQNIKICLFTAIKKYVCI